MNTTQSLIQALGSPDGTQRRHAALALGAQRDASVVGPLVERIRVEGDSCVREDLTWAIVQHADDAEQALSDLLVSDEPGDRRTAAHVLSKVANPEHFDRIRPLVADQHPDVAIKAYRAAANTGGAAAVEALATRIGDGDLLQRDALSNAFAKIGAASTGALVAALSSGRVETREHAAEAVGGEVGEEVESFFLVRTQLGDEAGLLERICLEGFQAGLSWELILRRRPAFRAAFADFDPDAVAAFGPADVERLMDDPSIVRNARKIEATIGNARATVALRSDGGLVDLVWSFQPSETIAPRAVEDIPTSSPEAAALAKELRKRGFRFVGPTTMYALMQAIGMVDAHLVGSPRRGSSGVWPA